jgi:hypothetical protein
MPVRPASRGVGRRRRFIADITPTVSNWRTYLLYAILHANVEKRNLSRTYPDA